ncbi:hypothetical protein [uncultured Duncaniella sp.]|uniref:hypothetical protein n=1 Tax=uncultured Duncaniella sp. TaxID=2768039 RepID=UPI00260D56BB|nr:hypothetical protein [uncultured Duncaniella sp.]
MPMVKAKIGTTIYDVIDYDTFRSNPDSFGYASYTAIRQGDTIYPVRSKTDMQPGFYPGGPMDFFKDPSPEQTEMYGVQNVINFSDAKTLREVIAAQQKLNNAERTILTTVNNVFYPIISSHDTPEMAGLKEAIQKKNIDLDSYGPRFGPNYNNDKRLLHKSSITFGKLRTIMDALDMKGTLILEDSASDVPNPIGEKIVVQLNGAAVESEDMDGPESESMG